VSTAVCGDADGDAVVTDVDATRVLRAAAALPGGCEAEVCDVDGNGEISDRDVVLVLRQAAGLPAALGCTPVLAPPGDPLSGGETTVFNATSGAFGFPAENLSDDERRDFFTGNALFNRNWVTAPSSTTGIDGLGPVFNARSCSACHPDDGRGRPPIEPDEDAVALLVRLSVPGEDALHGAIPEGSYGLQLNPFGLLTVPGEGRVVITYTAIPGTFADGDPFSLRRPTVALADLAYGPLDPATLMSARVGPGIVGMGLLAAVPDELLTDLADPDDQDGDGVSGRTNVVHDALAADPAIGRFGWKANVATIEEQTSGALLGDIGITTPLFAQENCTGAQTACSDAPNGGVPEADQEKVHLISHYVNTLAVPARRDLDDPVVRQGEALFESAGCAACHVPTLVTGPFPSTPALADQTIHPYTDLLLHDMGDDLADGRPDFAASGREWRTPPLWGIGLVPVVNGHALFLHDGRARGLAEAILWHGGEAAGARDAFRRMTRPARAALIRFLESL
jgi:CxxC motif-containing protein (DUF1111 family)